MWTPKKLIVAAPAVAGAVVAIKNAWDNHKFYNPSGGLSEPLGFAGVITKGGTGIGLDKNATAKVAVPLIGGAIASKGVAVGLKVVSKAAPVTNKVLNAKIARL